VPPKAQYRLTPAYSPPTVNAALAAVRDKPLFIATIRYRMVVSLSRQDWVEAALEALAADGLSAVAVEPLARRLGTTKGSFYWHFASRAELVAGTLELWERRETTETIEEIRRRPTPRERLVALGTGAYTAAATGGSALAAVLASASDSFVAPVLARVTRTRLAFLEELYRDLGAGPGEARRLARLAYAVYLGLAELRRSDPDHDLRGKQLDAFLQLAVDVMLAPAQAGFRETSRA
jgi:AcrR family transcriptional regulator